MSIQEIEQAIAALPAIQRADLLARLNFGELDAGISEAARAIENGEGQAWEPTEIEAIKQEGRARLAEKRQTAHG